ncbi:Uma2 family endonuclease [Streptomyces varsoviensis]|nr:Uma2 family endonuclease [Streptomyces varsoviensis]
MGAVMAAEARHEQWERATPENWMDPPSNGWTYDQVKELSLQFDWELVDGTIMVRGMTVQWHDMVRDGILVALRHTRRPPYAINSERCVMLDEKTVVKPDVVVFDKRGLDPFAMECVPVETVALAVEVVSPGSRAEDRFLKPGLFAESEIPHFWRVERGDDDLPVVHEFRRDRETGAFLPAPERPVHTGTLSVESPFPVELDLRSLVEL